MRLLWVLSRTPLFDLTGKRHQPHRWQFGSFSFSWLLRALKTNDPLSSSTKSLDNAPRRNLQSYNTSQEKVLLL